MITQIIIILWRYAGIPSLITSFAAYVFKFAWIHFSDVKGFVIIAFTILSGLSRLIIDWAEKGDIVKARWRKFITKRKREKKKKLG